MNLTAIISSISLLRRLNINAQYASRLDCASHTIWKQLRDYGWDSQVVVSFDKFSLIRIAGQQAKPLLSNAKANRSLDQTGWDASLSVIVGIEWVIGSPGYNWPLVWYVQSFSTLRVEVIRVRWLPYLNLIFRALINDTECSMYPVACTYARLHSLDEGQILTWETDLHCQFW